MEPDITDVAFHVEVEMEIPQARSVTWQYLDGNEDRGREMGQPDNDAIAKVTEGARLRGVTSRVTGKRFSERNANELRGGTAQVPGFLQQRRIRAEPDDRGDDNPLHRGAQQQQDQLRDTVPDQGGIGTGGGDEDREGGGVYQSSGQVPRCSEEAGGAMAGACEEGNRGEARAAAEDGGHIHHATQEGHFQGGPVYVQERVFEITGKQRKLVRVDIKLQKDSNTSVTHTNIL
jgi:hypothetical protein